MCCRLNSACRCVRQSQVKGSETILLLPSADSLSLADQPALKMSVPAQIWTVLSYTCVTQPNSCRLVKVQVYGYPLRATQPSCRPQQHVPAWHICVGQHRSTRPRQATAQHTLRTTLTLSWYRPRQHTFLSCQPTAAIRCCRVTRTVKKAPGCETPSELPHTAAAAPAAHPCKPVNCAGCVCMCVGQ